MLNLLRSLRRSLGLRLSKASVVVVPSILGAAILGLACYRSQPTASPDEWACAITIPLIINYVMVRLLIRVGTDADDVPVALSDSEVAAIRKTEVSAPGLVFLVPLFFIALWTAISAISSWPVFAWIDIGWAASAAKYVVKLSAIAMGISATLVVFLITGKSFLPRIAKGISSFGRSPLGWSSKAFHAGTMRLHRP